MEYEVLYLYRDDHRHHHHVGDLPRSSRLHEHLGEYLYGDYGRLIQF
jgi:hypothetical protein